MATVSAERLARIFVEVADTLVDEFDLVEFLQMLANQAAGLVEDSAVGLLLADRKGRLTFMAASDENAKLLELFQLQRDEGPCLEAFHSGKAVVNADLPEAESRWPQFAPRATTFGFRSVHAFPLRLRNEVIGAMNVFGTDVGGFDDTDTKIVQSLADIAVIGLLQERAISRGEVLTEQLQSALNSRVVIEQAKGAIAQAHGVTVDVAFSSIRAYARRTNRRLSDIAHLVVTDLPSLPELGKTEPVPIEPQAR